VSTGINKLLLLFLLNQRVNKHVFNCSSSSSSGGGGGGGGGGGSGGGAVVVVMVVAVAAGWWWWWWRRRRRWWWKWLCWTLLQLLQLYGCITSCIFLEPFRIFISPFENFHTLTYVPNCG